MNPDKSIIKEAAIDLLFQTWTPSFTTEEVSLDKAIYRVLSETQYSKVALPVVRASMMDGVGVSSEKFRDGKPITPLLKLNQDYVMTDTGDDFPDEFDTVIPIEDVLIDQNGVLKINENVEVKKGMNVSPTGSRVGLGELLMEKNIPIRPGDLGILAMGGIVTVPVYTKPKVAFIPTGSELIPIGEKLERGNNIDSNSLMAKHMLLEMGADPIIYSIVKDNVEELRNALFQALDSGDIVIINAGSSKGSEDYNIRLLEEEGKVLFHWTSVGPGRPICLAIVLGKPVIVLPGPPLGSFNALEWYIRPIIARCLNIPTPKHHKVKGILTKDLDTPKKLDFLCKVNVSLGENGEILITPINFRKERLVGCLASNALYYSKRGEEGFPKGSELEVEMLRGDEFIL